MKKKIILKYQNFNKQKTTESEARRHFAHKSAYIEKNVQIGKGTQIWYFSHIMKGTRIGKNCKIGQNVFIDRNVKIGNGVKIENNVSVYKKVTLEDSVFCGPSAVFTNVLNPRSAYPRKLSEYQETLKKKLPNIIRYWRAIENLHKTTKIDILFWGNSPHRYPGGIVAEICRINKVLVVGMQHGGMYGSNRAESTHFDLDYERCDFYFSYGFNTDDLKRAYPDKKTYPK